MRRLLVGCGGIVRSLAVRLTFSQKLGQTGQPVDVGPLTGDDVGQILDRAGQVGNPFLKGLDPVHATPFRALAAPCPIRYTGHD